MRRSGDDGGKGEYVGRVRTEEGRGGGKEGGGERGEMGGSGG